MHHSEISKASETAAALDHAVDQGHFERALGTLVPRYPQRFPTVSQRVAFLAGFALALRRVGVADPGVEPRTALEADLIAIGRVIEGGAGEPRDVRPRHRPGLAEHGYCRCPSCHWGEPDAEPDLPDAIPPMGDQQLSPDPLDCRCSTCDLSLPDYTPHGRLCDTCADAVEQRWAGNPLYQY